MRNVMERALKQRSFRIGMDVLVTATLFPWFVLPLLFLLISISPVFYTPPHIFARVGQPYTPLGLLYGAAPLLWDIVVTILAGAMSVRVARVIRTRRLFKTAIAVSTMTLLLVVVMTWP
jgi:hypothetical protein